MFFSKKKREQEKLIAEYKELLIRQKERIVGLVDENEKLKGKVIKFETERDRTLKTLDSATEKSMEVRANANAEYVVEIKRLKDFVSAWEKYYDGIMNKYPLNDELKRTKALTEKIKEIIGSNGNQDELSAKEKVEKLRGIFGQTEGGIFGEMAVSESGLDMNEVLNPTGELDLKELCKELGVNGN